MLVVEARAKDKKPIMPASVLNAETIAVIIDPNAGESITGDNRQARAEVESALRKWGRYQVLPFPENADLIVAVRRASGTVKPTIGRPPNDPPCLTPARAFRTVRCRQRSGSALGLHHR